MKREQNTTPEPEKILVQCTAIWECEKDKLDIPDLMNWVGRLPGQRSSKTEIVHGKIFITATWVERR